jgi:hypothetical protein
VRSAIAELQHGLGTVDSVETLVIGGVITDSHFGARDRLGRLIAFLARIVKDGWASSVRGIGVDEATAILVEPSGSATRVGSGAAYFVSSNGTPATCVSGSPLKYTGLATYKVSGAATFNLATWIGSGGTAYTLNVNAGALSRQIHRDHGFAIRPGDLALQQIVRQLALRETRYLDRRMNDDLETFRGPEGSGEQDGGESDNCTHRMSCHWRLSLEAILRRYDELTTRFVHERAVDR